MCIRDRFSPTLVCVSTSKKQLKTSLEFNLLNHYLDATKGQQQTSKKKIVYHPLACWELFLSSVGAHPQPRIYHSHTGKSTRITEQCSQFYLYFIFRKDLIAFKAPRRHKLAVYILSKSSEYLLCLNFWTSFRLTA